MGHFPGTKLLHIAAEVHAALHCLFKSQSQRVKLNPCQQLSSVMKAEDHKCAGRCVCVV